MKNIKEISCESCGKKPNVKTKRELYTKEGWGIVEDELYKENKAICKECKKRLIKMMELSEYLESLSQK